MGSKAIVKRGVEVIETEYKGRSGILESQRPGKRQPSLSWSPISKIESKAQ